MQVRVSIGNLAPRIISKESEKSENGQFVSILNSGAFKKGRKLLQPIGGAVELTAMGRAILVEQFGATDFHKNDARFVVDDALLGEVFAFFTIRDSLHFEIDPVREIQEELSKEELPDIPAVLSAVEAASIEVMFVKTVRQKFSDEMGTSPLAVEGLPSRRLFHLFQMLASQAIVEKMTKSEAIRFLSDDEVATTEGGLKKGMTSDGIQLADNLIW